MTTAQPVSINITVQDELEPEFIRTMECIAINNLTRDDYDAPEEFESDYLPSGEELKAAIITAGIEIANRWYADQDGLWVVTGWTFNYQD
jgi:hypothetical protein